MMPNRENPSEDKKSEFEYVSEQFQLAHQWLKLVRKCDCILDETSDDCPHIRKALEKLYGSKIEKIWRQTIKEGIENMSKAIGLKIPYQMQKQLTSESKRMGDNLELPKS